MKFANVEELLREAANIYMAWHRGSRRRTRMFPWLAQQLGIYARAFKYQPFVTPSQAIKNDQEAITHALVLKFVQDASLPSVFGKAMQLAEIFYQGQTRKFVRSVDPETPHAPYLSHPVRVAAILARSVDPQADPQKYTRLILAGLFHDAIEGYPKSERKTVRRMMREMLIPEIGKVETGKVIRLVEACTWPTGLRGTDRKIRFAAGRFGNSRKTSDEACLVKIADLLANAEEAREEIEWKAFETIEAIRAIRGQKGRTIEEKREQKAYEEKQRELFDQDFKKAQERHRYYIQLYRILAKRGISEAQSMLREIKTLISKPLKLKQQNFIYGARRLYQERFEGGRTSRNR